MRKNETPWNKEKKTDEKNNPKPTPPLSFSYENATLHALG